MTSPGHRADLDTGTTTVTAVDRALDSAANDLPLTGERTVPGVLLERYWYLRHEVAYGWLPRWLPPAGLVIEAGCGEGYGAALLSDAGFQVIAVDDEEAVVDHVRRRYPQVEVMRAGLDRLPIATQRADAVVSLQVIEHLWDLSGFLAESARVLRSGGVIVVSTPNRPTFSPGLARGEKPTNPFHVEEFDAEQVREMLEAAGLRDVSVLGVHHGGRIRRWEAQHGSIVAAHVEAVMTGVWNPALLELLPTLEVSDFELGQASEALDLIGIGVN